LSSFPEKGRLLGVDFGSVRVGLAICDPDRIIASPWDTLQRKTEQQDAAALNKIIQSEKIVGIVLGLPISLNGNEGPKAKETREYGDWLTQITALPITYWDERFTSALADDAMFEAGLTHKKRKEKRDRIAAQIMLQGFLDSLRK
jgi:putative holliday junction resolvase